MDVGSKKCMPLNCLDLENYLDLTFDVAICVGGIIYWRIRSRYIPTMELRKFLTFDLELEEFRVITCPLRYRWYSDDYLVDFEGELCLIDRVSQLPGVLDIWVLKDHKNETWTKIYTIDCSHFDQELSLLSRIHEAPRRLYPLQIAADSDGEKAILIKLNKGFFYYYNLKTKTFAKIGDCGESCGRVFVHCNSLFHLPSCRLVKPTS